MTGLAATGTPFTVGTPVLNFGIFAFFVVVTLVIAVSVARKKQLSHRLLRGRAGVFRPAERHRDRR